ncbi:helix-turn-helix domain-containing protein [Paenibacillus contaminans]|uniref:HTH araC/xylS-type domain-containing protein n=1 Tax=Paenibacillus contaminans TaxID=450362 RepID=A0A329M100_9BACL|nr:helix-turn-helix domain-containing protein [Paenibacillus contaminans]RAV13340.1 hypothetical protein DQG23_33585 [Paenibacillus contaminans]
MKWIRKAASRKYWLKMFLSVVLLSILFIVIVSTALFYNSKSTLSSIQFEANGKMLDQVIYNIDFTNKLLQTLIASTYSDSRTAYLMDTAQTEAYKRYPSIMSFEKIMNSSPLLQAVTVYNAHSGCYYYYADNEVLDCKGDGMSGKLDHYLRTAKHIPKLQLVPMYFEDEPEGGRKASHFSFFMYTKDETSGDRGSMLIFHVKPEWLFANISEINRLTKYANSKIMILDKNGIALNAWNDGEFSSQYQLAISEKIGFEKLRNGEPSSFFLNETDNGTNLITYATSQANGWTIVSIQPYDTVMNVIGRMQSFSITIIALVLLGVLASSILLVSRLYNPIARVLYQIRRSIQKEGTASNSTLLERRGEFGFISSMFEEAMTEVRMLKVDKQAQSAIVKSYFWRKLILDSSNITLEELQAQTDAALSESEKYVLCLLKLDRYHEFTSKFDQAERKLYKFAIGNIAQDLLSECSVSHIVDMGNDHLIILVRIGQSETDAYARICESLQALQGTVRAYYKLGLTAVISDETVGHRDITQQYEAVMDHAKYRLVFGKHSLITPAMIRERLENTNIRFPAEWERKWVEAFKSADYSMYQSYLSRFFERMAQLNYDNVIDLLLHLRVLANQTIQEMNRNTQRQRSLEMGNFLQQIMVQETLEDISRLFLDLFHEVSEKRQSRSPDNQANRRLVVDTIKEIVEQQYADPNLCLQTVADMVKLSPAYAGKLYRSSEDMSVAEYITAVRLNHAIRLMENNSLSINHIMESVGFSNQSYFFKLFKRRFGATPNEYRSNI